MKKTVFAGAVLFAWVGMLSAHADEIQYSCDGTYDSKVAYDQEDPSTVSVKAHLEMTMLGDQNSQGEYSMTKAKLTMKATNDNNADAGSFVTKKPISGKIDRALNVKFKGHIKFDLGSKNAAAYPQDGDEPETYLLVPTDDSDTIYVQRQGSGHDSYPTITLKCN